MAVRENIMVLPEYQRKGLGRLLAAKLDETVDAVGGTVYVIARYTSAPLFRSMGYKVVETFTCNFEDFGGVGQESFYGLKRGPGAVNDETATKE